MADENVPEKAGSRAEGSAGAQITPGKGRTEGEKVAGGDANGGTGTGANGATETGAGRRPPLRSVNRRQFLGLGGAGAASLVVGGVAGHYILQPSAAAPITAPPPPLRFFNQVQANVVTAMAERIFPADEESPGATDARVVNYIDGQLAGGWGVGQRMYRQAPFVVPPDSGHGWQYPLTPAEAFRAGLEAIDAHTQKQYGKAYDALTADQQDQVLTAMAANKIDTFTEIGALDFYTLFHQTVMEGLFEDPMYGGNHNMIGWKWVGFPGYQMNGMHYAEHIDKYDDGYHPAPMTLAGSKE